MTTVKRGFSALPFLLIVIVVPIVCDQSIGDKLVFQFIKSLYRQKRPTTHSFTLTIADYNKPYNETEQNYIRGPDRYVPLLEGVREWHLEYRVFGYQSYNTISAFLVAPGSLVLSATFSVERKSHDCDECEVVHDPIVLHKVEGRHLKGSRYSDVKLGINKLITRDQFLDLLDNDTMTIRCDVKFQVPFLYYKQDLSPIFKYVEPDYGLRVENKIIKVHRHFLSLLSPIFDKMIINSTHMGSTEMVIDDFSFDTIKTAMNISYGHIMYNLTELVIIDVLKFAVKYDIKVIVDELEDALFFNISAKNFHAITNFVWKNDRKRLQQKFISLFKKYPHQLTSIPGFNELDPIVTADLVQAS